MPAAPLPVHRRSCSEVRMSMAPLGVTVNEPSVATKRMGGRLSLSSWAQSSLGHSRRCWAVL